MVISDERRFIFIHVPKSGGTSCSFALTRILNRRDKNHWALSKKTKHETLLQIKLRLKKNKIRHWLPFTRYISFERYFSFGFVRNPWDRVVSTYHYLKETNIRPEIQNIDSFNHFIHEMSENRDWIMGLHSMRLQVDFFTDAEGKIIADFIGRFENLNKDFNKICQNIGLQTELPYLNPSTHRKYREYYNKETKKLVSHKFSLDIDYFGYTF
jgi:hypothetical protein